MLQQKTIDLRVTGNDDDAFLEIGLLLDCTSSMSSWIERAKETLLEIIDKIIEGCKEDGEKLNVRVSFIGYRDIGDKDARFVIKPFTDDIQSVKTQISNCNA